MKSIISYELGNSAESIPCEIWKPDGALRRLGEILVEHALTPAGREAQAEAIAAGALPPGTSAERVIGTIFPKESLKPER